MVSICATCSPPLSNCGTASFADLLTVEVTFSPSLLKLPSLMATRSPRPDKVGGPDLEVFDLVGSGRRGWLGGSAGSEAQRQGNGRCGGCGAADWGGSFCNDGHWGTPVYVERDVVLCITYVVLGTESYEAA